MGMFDSFYDQNGDEWQTKAMDCNLDVYDIGDRLTEPPGDFQMEVIGPCGNGGSAWAWVTIREGVVAEVGVERDPSLVAIGYGGGPFIRPANGDPTSRDTATNRAEEDA